MTCGEAGGGLTGRARARSSPTRGTDPTPTSPPTPREPAGLQGAPGQGVGGVGCYPDHRILEATAQVIVPTARPGHGGSRRSAPARRVRAAAVLSSLCAVLVAQSPGPTGGAPPWQAFVATAARDRRTSTAALDAIAAGWRDDYAGMIVDVARFLPSPRTPGVADEGPGPAADEADGLPGGSRGSDLPTPVAQPAGSEVRRRLTGFLQRQTGQKFGNDLRAWRRWIWSRPTRPHAQYAEFKAELYSRIDPRFRRFFPSGVRASIRLDEIDWGGVSVNGIPPLRSPRVEPAAAASWLRDGHIVFGVVVNGEARAYPKRILAWHEMAIDRVGGIDLTVVYCTLCGTVIPYESTVGGKTLSFGTSGLLYRSNKLMFDEETGSLWSALEGVPVVGPLVGQDLRLTFRSVVTTTWGEWKRDHPGTTVVSIETGFDRDYAENVAYRDYFSHDRLMFETPTRDARLRNKAEVVVLRPEVLGGATPAVAIPVDTLRRAPVFPFEVGGRRLVAITSKGGANRIYDRGAWTFTAGPDDRTVVDGSGRAWTVTTAALVGRDGERLLAVPSHRAFWFGWVAQHPATLLIR